MNRKHVLVHEEQTDIINKIIQIKEKLPNKQRRLCNYIIENYQEIGLMTVKELAKRAKVGTTTVMRVLEVLDFDSFHDFKKELHKKTLELTTWWHLKKSFSSPKRQDENHPQRQSNITEIWKELMNLLTQTLTDDLVDHFERAVSLMVQSSRINILGLRSSKVAALYIGYMLEEFTRKVKQLSLDGDFLYDRLLQVEPDEMLMVFAHSPYSVQTIEIARFAHERNIPIVLITDLLSCPIAPFASAVLKIKASVNQYSIVPTIALIEALVIEYGRRTAHSSIHHLEKLGKLLIEKNVTTL